ncbi:chemotaxis protein CheW [Gluconacetobacter sacchari DSM 12717]|uniref:Chemotaxis protein CheW n=2 Tax=Gluconacetobacter sacchari TaxID=92759 RepID=A0A7W4IG68_9PROT|nr:chemotaxis protein CheW [Gluconacetobacter sacchari]GBQ30645.1 chemotaxis protein CheW [Gluconacetobacter sacchari DSM 12717]
MEGSKAPVSVAVVIFRLVDTCYGLPAPAVRECVAMPELVRPAGTPAPVLGFFRLGGERVAAIDLAVLLGLRDWLAPDAAAMLYRPLLLCGAGAGVRTAFMVDGVLDVRPMAGAVTALPDDARPAGDWLAGEVELVGGMTALLMDPDRLLMERERRRIEALARDAALRDAVWEGADV